MEVKDAVNYMTIKKKWSAKEPLGKKLRHAMSQKDSAEILKTIFEIAEKWSKETRYNPETKSLEKFDTRGEFQELVYLVDQEWCYTDDELPEYDWSGWDELVDARLTMLYDLCDDYRIWLDV